jgi:hypothetical protein
MNDTTLIQQIKGHYLYIRRNPVNKEKEITYADAKILESEFSK